MSLSLADARAHFGRVQTKSYMGHRLKVHSVAWNGTGDKLASGSVDQTIHVWTIDRIGQHIDTVLTGHTNSVDQLCFDPTNPNCLASASADRSVRIWDTRSPQKPIRVIATSGENINIVYSPDGSHLAVGNKEDLVSIIDTRKYQTIKSTQFPFEVNEITWDPSGQLFFLTTGSGNIEVMRFPDLERVCSLQAHTANCYCIEFDPSGRYFAAGSADALVSLWSADDMVCLRTFGRLDWPIRTLSFSCDSSFIASASEDLVIDISHVETGELVYQIACKAAMNTVAWHPSNLWLAYAGDEKHKHTDRDEGSVKIFGFAPR